MVTEHMMICEGWRIRIMALAIVIKGNWTSDCHWWLEYKVLCCSGKKQLKSIKKINTGLKIIMVLYYFK